MDNRLSSEVRLEAIDLKDFTLMLSNIKSNTKTTYSEVILCGNSVPNLSVKAWTTWLSLPTYSFCDELQPWSKTQNLLLHAL